MELQISCSVHDYREQFIILLVAATDVFVSANELRCSITLLPQFITFNFCLMYV